MRDSLIQAGYVLDPGTQTWRRPEQRDIAYNDGDAAESHLARVIADSRDVSVLSAEIKTHIVDWHTLYHLSGQRANVLRPLAGQLAGADVLEIGCGCGAISRYLGETAGRVLALDGTARRAAIARSRTRDLSNVAVVVDSFMEFRSDARFDVITLIGVLEYAHVFSDAPDAAAATLRKVHSLLKPGGRLVIAIENQLGLKYFAGAKEDHMGVVGYGIEGRYGKGQPRTWGRKALQELLGGAGFGGTEFLYPFPDYKLPASIVTEAGWQVEDFDAGALASQSARRDPQLPRLLGFAPERVWPELHRNGLGRDLANSFIVVARPAPGEPDMGPVLAHHYSTDRAPAYCKETLFVRDAARGVDVRYRRLGRPPEAAEAGGEAVRFHLPERSDYVRGRTMATELAEIVSVDGWRIGAVGQFLRKFLDVVASKYAPLARGEGGSGGVPEFPGEAFDLVPQNIIVTASGGFEVIDQEWTLGAPVPAHWLALRALLLLLNSVSRLGRPADEFERTREGFVLAALWSAGLPAAKEDLDALIRREAAIQSAVSGRPADSFLDWGADRPLPFEDLSVAAANQEQAIVQLSAENRALRGTIAEIHGSRSWKFGAPIRFAGLLAKGQYGEARSRLWGFTKRQLRRLPPGIRMRLVSARTAVLGALRVAPETSTDLSAIQPMTARRPAFLEEQLDSCSRRPHALAQWPAVDISAVLHNNGRWLDGFIDSLLALDYPRGQLRVLLIDNGSTDQTPQQMAIAVERLQAQGIDTVARRQRNVGFGGGHNAALDSGTAPYWLVTNVDLTFAPDALRTVVAQAVADPKGAAWELRQKPYEHPKYYDPVTGETNWNSHACVLLRREAVAALGGYDDNLFMYGEDVELSYRLRRAGWLLRYCPAAVVNHYSYETAGEVKPLQYTGSTFANLYLRLKYGALGDIAVVPAMALGLLLRPPPFPGARGQVLRSLGRLLVKAPRALAARASSVHPFTFRLWDYEVRRLGDFHATEALPADCPLVTVVTRTYAGRDRYLLDAIVSVARQTWPQVELVVVQDGGHSLRPLVEETATRLGLACTFVAAPKLGRSAAGNAGLEAAKGRWCMFLDDDDLLYADHIEVLAQALRAQPGAVAAYSPAWELLTATDAGGPPRDVGLTVPPVLRHPFDRQELAQRNLMAIQSVLFERQLYAQRGGFDTDLDQLEDWVLWNVYARGNTFAFVPKLTSLFRTPADPVTRERRAAALNAAYETARNRMALRGARFG